MRKKKIAILADYPYWLHDEELKHNNSNPAPWLVALRQAFTDKGIADDKYEIYWITLSRRAKRFRTIQVDSQTIHIVPAVSRTLAQYIRYLPDRWVVGRLLKRLAPDIVHAWGTEGSYGLIAKDFIGKKLFSLQGALTAYSQRGELPPFTIRQARFEKEILNAMPIITTESEWARERVLELVPDADVRLWEYATEERFFQYERQISSSPCCLQAGTNTKIKNVTLSIKAFSRPELRHVKLYLAGVAPRAYDSLPDNIIPLGFVGREKILQLLRSNWSLVHPSLADCCPNIVKEARVMGLPCVVTTECGAKQYVVQGKSGYIIPPNDEQALVDAVLAMTADTQTSLAMGRFDRERCREELSQSVMLNGILKLYEEILEN